MSTAKTITMANKSLVLSPPERPVSVNGESIWRKPLTKRELETLHRMAKSQLEEDDSDIDYSDIPELTDEQLAGFRRVEIDPGTGKPVLPPKE